MGKLAGKQTKGVLPIIDRYKLYTKVLKEMMTLSHHGHLMTLAMLIAGIVAGRNAQLSAVSAEIGVEAKDKSIEMRLRDG
jgi:hypothetical protein